LLLEAICGVNQTDIDRDYELTSFSKDHTGKRVTRTRNSTWANGLKPMIALINEMEGNSFKEKVVGFLLRAGVTIDEINDIRFGLIDGNPEKIISPYETETVNVSYNLGNATMDNLDETTAIYQPYKATIKALDDYKIDTVSITMGSSDVSNYYKNGIIEIPLVTDDFNIDVTTT
jgi:hypothetical protein